MFIFELKKAYHFYIKIKGYYNLIEILTSADDFNYEDAFRLFALINNLIR